MRFMAGLVERLGIAGELLAFFWQHKWWWLTPLAVLLLIFGFLIIFAQLNYIQVFASSRLKNNAANPRIILAEYRNQRGAILARDERTVLARSVATKNDLKYLRVYPHGSLYGQITGYYSFTYGRSGLESSQNDWLAGTASQLVPETFVDELLGRPKRGATVVTTIDAKLQQTAARALGSRIRSRSPSECASTASQWRENWDAGVASTEAASRPKSARRTQGYGV